MSLRYPGTLEDLRVTLAGIGEGVWEERNENLVQFRHDMGGILNWHPVTGTLSFQGKASGKVYLQAEVEAILRGDQTAKATVALAAEVAGEEVLLDEAA